MTPSIKKYSEFREKLKLLIGSKRPLYSLETGKSLVREKGRKTDYREYNLVEKEWKEKRRDLNMEEYGNFIEVSLRAAACPMPLNADVWDGLRCPYRCAYCFADSFRASLYSSFFDNTKTMGLRHCSRDYLNRELDRVFRYRGKAPEKMNSALAKAIALEIPIRLGIRFEDFTKAERKEGVALWLLERLKEEAYPVMLNTKSDLVGSDAYVRALVENPAGSAVHITMISSSDELGKRIEPGAPLMSKRWETARILQAAGVRVVARIEPYMALINDLPEDIQQYIDLMKKNGINNITADTYSYSAGGEGVKNQFERLTGLDFERMFMLTSDSQPLGSLALGMFLGAFRAEGFSVSTFDGGNIPKNSQMVCCEVGDVFSSTPFNRGSMVAAIRFIQSRGKQATSWQHFYRYVQEGGGFLSPGLEREVHELWNNDGGTAYQLHWAPHLQPIGWNKYGVVWNYNETITDYREVLWQRLIQNL